MSKREQLAWAAGFVDGDGHFSFHKTRRALQLDVGQKYREPLDRLKTIFGCGTIYGPYPPRSLYSYRIGEAEQTIRVLGLIEEFLSPYRLRQAKEAVAAWENRPGHDRYLTDEERDEIRERYALGFESMHTLADQFGRDWSTIQRACVGIEPDTPWVGRNSVLTDSHREELRDVYAQGGVTQRELAEDWGISQSLVAKVVAA